MNGRYFYTNLKRVVAGTCIALFLLLFMTLKPVLLAAAQMSPDNQAGTQMPIMIIHAGQDLIIQSVTMNPPNPAPNQSTDITIVIKNTGSSAIVNGFYTYLYIDPAGQPPTVSTSYTSRYGHFLGLNSGATFTWSYTDITFPSAGCGHKLYVWVDRENSVAEDNETNNLSSIDFCVGVSPVDSYEPDNVCANAKSINTDGTVQTHNFSPAGDVDWVKFNATGGVWYVVNGINVGTNSKVELELHSSCDQPPSFGGGNPILEIQPLTDGTYYIKAVNTNTGGGLQTDYTLSVRTMAECAGFFEPNDTQSTAKDITPGDPAQIHSFCRALDQDWVSFATQAGQTYTVTSTAIGSKAAPMLEGFDLAHPNDKLQGTSLNFVAGTVSRFYVKAINSRENYGVDTSYSLMVTTQGCVGDAAEPDNSRATAHSMIVDSVPEKHNFCPAADHDWLKFSVQAGQTYTIETTGIGRLSDTQICLRDNLGNQIACDDDSGVQKGSKITWQASAAGDYFVEVSQLDTNAAGPDTLYEASISSGQCRMDLYEPDDTVQQARVLTLNSPMLHNFCPAADKDWVKVTIPATGNYVFQTQLQSSGADTMLKLFDTDGKKLGSNDDYGLGLSSQLTHNFSVSGTYYLEISHYNPSKVGRSTAYTLLVQSGTATSTPTPTQAVPTATPTRTPPPNSGIKTLIITNRERFTALYGVARTNSLFTKLSGFANNPYVQGEIMDVGANSSVVAQYTEWLTHVDNVNKANQTSAAIRSLISNYLDAHASVLYIVIVGDDQIIPFRRIADRTSFSELEYTFVDASTAIGSAIAENYFLTDDYYADRQPNSWQDAEIYIPDLPIGRLIHTPEQINGLIDGFNNNSELQLDKILVTGYDFVKDSATNMCELYSQDIGASKLDCTLIGENWSGTQLKSKQLSASPAFKLQTINGHANHISQGAPVNPPVTSYDIVNSSSDLTGALIYSVGCHAGLDPELPTNNMVSLAQAFSQKGANYVGNTGFGWGSGEGAFFSERMMQNFTQELLKGSSTTIGAALLSAKQRYYQEADGFEVRDEKVLQQVVLYGFPMYSIRSGAVLGNENPFPDASISFTLPTSMPSQVSPESIQSQVLATPMPGKAALSILIGTNQTAKLASESLLSGYTLKQTNWGQYYQLDGHTSTRVDAPLQPRLYTPLSLPAGIHIRGAIFTGGTFSDTQVNPVIAAGTNEFVPVFTEPAFTTQGFFPPVPFSLQLTDDIIGAKDVFTISLGQYDAQSGTQRLYENVLFDVYYSTSADQTGPEVRSVTGMYDTKSQRAYFKIEATDPSTVVRVVIAHTTGTNNWVSQDLSFDPSSYKWLGSVPGIRNATYFVQVLDGAGNVTILSRKGGYFTLDDVVLTDRFLSIYLPNVIK